MEGKRRIRRRRQLLAGRSGRGKLLARLPHGAAPTAARSVLLEHNRHRRCSPYPRSSSQLLESRAQRQRREGGSVMEWGNGPDLAGPLPPASEKRRRRQLPPLLSVGLSVGSCRLLPRCRRPSGMLAAPRSNGNRSSESDDAGAGLARVGPPCLDGGRRRGEREMDCGGLSFLLSLSPGW